MKTFLSWLLKILLSILVLIFIYNIKTVNVSANDVKEDKKRVIYFVLDDSGSMFKNDKKEGVEQEYYTKWVEADYAVKALAATMNEGDKFKLYIMGEYYSVEHNTNLGEQEKKTLQDKIDSKKVIDIQDKVDNMDKISVMTAYDEYVAKTCFLSVVHAVNDMKNYDSDEYECWIIVLSDGEYDCPECQAEIKKGNKTSQKWIEGVRKKLQDIKKDQSNMFIQYFFITDQDISLPADNMEEGVLFQLIQNNGGSGDSILEAVVKASNRIYGRMGRRYSDLENIKIDIPVSQLMIFAQNEGEEQLWEEADYEMKQQQDAMTLDIEGINSSFTIKNKNINIAGRIDLPDNANKFISDARYKQLGGILATYKRKTGLTGKIEDTLIPMITNANDNVIYEVYYQPDVQIKPVFYQGENIVGIGSSFLREGEMRLEILLADRRGQSFTYDSKLLQLEDFKVTLVKSETRESVDLMEQNEMSNEASLCYKGALQIGSYDLTIVTPWGATYTETDISVKEQRFQISMIVSGDYVISPENNGKQNKLIIQVLEDGAIPETDRLEKIILRLSIDSQDWGYKLYREDIDQGLWALELEWRDPENHIGTDHINIQLTSEREYQGEEPEIAEEEITVDVIAGMLKLETRITDEEEVHPNIIQRIQKIADFSFTCGTLLTEEQSKTVKNTILEVSDLNKKMFTFKDGDLQTSGIWKWLFTNLTEIQVKGKSEYVKWNQVVAEEWSMIVKIQPIPMWIQMIIKIIVAFATAFILQAIFSLIFKQILKKDFISGKIDFHLDGLGHESPLHKDSLRSIWYRIWFFSRTRCYRNGYRNGKGNIPEFVIKVKNGDADWFLVNYTDLQSKEDFKINNRRISEHNAHFNHKELFTVKDLRGTVRTLSWRKK